MIGDLANIYEHVFPVIGGYELNKDTYRVQQVYGTSFSLGGGFFATAAHVIRNANKHPVVTVGFTQPSKSWSSHSIERFELFEDFDFAVFYAPKMTNTKQLRWAFCEMAILDGIRTFGYPHAYDSEHAVINARGFCGHIVTDTIYYLLRAKPKIFELSCQCPKGISGAPLIADNNEVIGMIVGNRSVETVVFSEKEVLIEKAHTHQLERLESMHLGIALTSTSMSTIYSKILNNSLLDHLLQNRLTNIKVPSIRTKSI